VISDPLTQLLSHTNAYPLLKATAEHELARRIERGDLDAKERLVVSNIRLVVSIARHYQGHGLTLPDLVQEGMLGLIRATEKFDYRLGNRFSTYASLWIRQSIFRGLEKTGRSIRIPAHMNRAARRLATAERNLEDALGRAPSIEELMAAADLPRETVDLLLHVSREPTSLDSPIGDGSQTLGDLVLVT
jgi:RNA polymerase primary sigma factor